MSNMSIPLINVSEIEDEEDLGVLSAEALTDVEDLDQDENTSRFYKRKGAAATFPPKSNEPNTDIEDAEASDEDSIIKTIKHKNPKLLDNLELCRSSVEEIQNIHSKAFNHKTKLCRQKSLTTDVKEHHESDNVDMTLTDSELIETSDNEMLEAKIPEIYFPADHCTEYTDSVLMKESVKGSVNPTPSPPSTPPLLLQGKSHSSLSLTPSKFNFTDIEFLESEREGEMSPTKKTKKLRKRRSKTTSSVNTVESQNLEFRFSKSMNQFNIKKGQIQNENPTEIEDFDDNIPACPDSGRGRYSCGGYLHNQGDCHVKICEKKRQRLKKSLSSPSPLLQSRDDTDVEFLESENMGEQILKRAPGPDLTDEEILLDKDENINYFPDVKLPRVKREMVLIRENDCANPNIAVVPLDDNFEPGLCLDLTRAVLTDTESLSGGSVELKADEFEDEVVTLETDGGVLTEAEISKVHEARIQGEDNTKRDIFLNIPVTTNEKVGLTDTEDLVLSELDQGDLSLTDVEQMETSDEEVRFIENRREACTPTHMREMAGATIIAKEGKQMDTKKRERPNIYLAGPSLSNNEDGFTPKNKQAVSKDLLHLKEKNSPEYHTDVEDINLSGDEVDGGNFSTEIMYLKGGGYRATRIFLLRPESGNHDALGVEWSAAGRPSQAESVSAKDLIAEQDATLQETSSVPLTKPTTETTSETKSLADVPKPKPRITKSPDNNLELTCPLEKVYVDKTQKSPVRDDTLDADASPPESYSLKKKFWENVSKDAKLDVTVKKRLSLFEDAAADKVSVAKKRVSIHEVSVTPPVPKPRIGLQSSLSISETQKDELRLDEVIEKPMTEYQVAFADPALIQASKPIPDLEETPPDLEKADSFESEPEASSGGNNQSAGFENNGYISDSGDVEHYISDSEIEDRVPQIRDRQMSVFHAAPATYGRKNIYERSLSLPTEDLYDLAAKTFLLKKQYYEEQIRKEMVEDQLMTELEEEPSPEHKTLSSLSVEEEEPPGMRSAPEESQEGAEPTSVRDLAKTFGETVIKTSLKLDAKLEQEQKLDQTSLDDEKSEERRSVKDLARSFEGESGSFIMGQKIMPSKQLKTTSVTQKEISDEEHTQSDESEIDKLRQEDFKRTLESRDLKSSKELMIKSQADKIDGGSAQIQKHIEESIDDTSTDITMQDFETSEELGSKELDEIPSYKPTQDEIQAAEISQVSVQEKVKSDDLDEMEQSITESDSKVSDTSKKLDSVSATTEELVRKEETKDQYVKDDLSELEEKSDASKITYASDIEKDHLYSDQIETTPHKIAKLGKSDDIDEELDYQEKLVADVSDKLLPDKVPLSSEKEKDADTIAKAHKPDLSDDVLLKQEAHVLTHKPDLDDVFKPDTTHKEDGAVYKREDQRSVSQTSETHKETDLGSRIQQSSTESEQSVFSERSVDMHDYKDDVASKPSDSMEVHVDKSEIEDSEKMADLDQDATDIETKSLDSLNATEMSPKTSFNADENLPEITISLSGKQRRISEESEEYDKEEKDLPSKTLEKSESSSQIYQSEEHIQDTVWEVSVESQPQETFDERVAELNLGKQIFVEKDDELSSSVHDESDLGSEIHQDHSESYASEKAKSDSHSEIEKLILESLHQQKISEEEAKIIASELLADIEAEIQKRQSLSVQMGEPPAPEIAQNEVSEYLRQLAETKGLDSREVELVQSVLARKQRQLARFTRGDTQASSMEITDEDLKFSGTEIDFSPSASRAHILEEQIDQLEAEKMLEREYPPDLEKSYKEKMGKEHFERPQTKKDAGEKSDAHTTKTEMKVTETVKHFTEKKDAIIEEEESVVESLSEESDTLHKTVDIAVDQITEKVSPDVSESKKEHIDISEEDFEKTDVKSKLVETKTEEAVKSLSHTDTLTEKIDTLSGKSEIEEKAHEKIDDGETIKSSTKLQELYEQSKKETEETVDQSEETKIVGDVETTLSEIAVHKKVSSTTYRTDKSHEETTVISSKILGDSDLSKLITKGKLTLDNEKGDGMKPEIIEAIAVTHEDIQRTFSDESKSSQEETKSPEEPFSTCSSEKKGGDSDSKVDLKADVVFRKIKRAKDGDTSSSSSILKPDRRSGVEFECYSSSGESHYQSFELDSGKSRPCSSDVEGLIAAGSSEYESALTSQDISAPSHLTSYHTAVSSLSSKESMKSLDSESSGNLASVEVSEASETLVPSEYESGDALDTTGPTFDDFSVDRVQLPKRQSTELSDSELLYPDMHESIDISEEEADIKISEDVPTKMKRSYEMTFQPEPKVLVPESPQSELTQEMDERFGTSLDDGSVLSVSLSSTSSAAALRTVIELSHAESERQEGSMTISGTSEQISFDDAEYMLKGSRESLIAAPTSTPLVTADTSTSTHVEEHVPPVGSVTITTSTVKENGIQSVSTQVTSQTHTPEQEAIFSIDDINLPPKQKEDSQVIFDPKKRGHRRYESTTPFTAGIVPVTTTSLIEMERKFHSDLAESDKYTAELSIKEGRSDEKKDVDELEKEECYETEADQAFHRDLREGRYLETEYDENDVFDLSRPHSQVSKSDSDRDRITSTGLSDDRPDSELAELAKQCSSEAVSDPIERPVTPEPCEPCDECEIKDDTPEFSSEAQASVGELEQEYTSAVARSQEIAEIKKQILTEVTIEKLPQHRDIFEKRESHGKLSGASSEKSSFEEAEAEAAFSMVAHVSPAHKVKQICPILEDEDAEKHELETRERAQKELEERRALMKDLSPGFIPDIKVTQHMAPLVDRGFRYPDLELEEKDETQKSTPQTPASSKSSESTDQGREYILDESAEAKAEESTAADEKDEKVESRSEVGTVIEKTIYEADKETASPTESPNSDSFEMLEKPDLIDDFVVIEEVAKEASELDMEGKSVKITSRKFAKKHDQELEEYLAKSATSPTTKLTEVKYYPNGSSSDELGFEFEDSPPQPGEKAAGVSTKSPRDYVYEYDRELEANRKWIEEQFQNNQAAMIAAGYGYEMEFERGPLEDIKEEDVTDFDSSRIGSLSSQKESGGSLGGSVKDSYSSTPEYDVLAGRKYFTRSGDHDDVSMSSLQEFENLERAMSLENRRHITGSQESSSNGSFKNRYYASRSGQGDDVSVSSLKEFEGLEKACIAVHTIEVKVKEEEAMLSQIDEGPESIASESESCETISGTDKKIIPDSDEEDYEKRMFEIDEIIRQAQSNVERFIEAEKTESLGRGDSFEEVAKVPDLDLDTPIARASKVQWADADDLLRASTDSLDLKTEKPSHHDSTDSLDQKTTAADIMTASTDSIEFQAQKSARDNIMSDSIEIKDGDRSYMITSDSLELGTVSNANLVTSDSIDEDGSRIGGQDQSSSSTGKDFSSSVKEDMGEPEAKQGEYMLESTDSIASTSTATNATYQYETDSVFSGSFTSGGSNTMVSSTDTIDPPGAYMKDAVDLATAVRKVWFDDDSEGAAKKFTTEYTDDTSKPYVTEVIEPCEEDGVYSHTIHRRVELPPEVRKITFKGPDADQQLRQFIENFGEGEDVQESEHVDADGNVHVTRVIQKRYVVKSDDEKPMSGPDIEEYFKQFDKAPDGKGVIRSSYDDGHGSKTIYTQQFDIQQLKDQEATTRMTSAGVSAGEPSTAPQKSAVEQAPEQATTFRAESEETTGQKEGEGSQGQQRSQTDQQQLSEEMKELLKELERESKK